MRKFPKARERKMKDKAIVHMLVERYGFQEGVPVKELVNFVQDYATYDRAWRKILFENPGLRGTDYEDKERLEQERMIDLGYEPGYGSKLPAKSS